MPITWSIDSNKRRVYVTLTPPYTRDHGLAAATSIVAHPEFAPSFGFVVESVGMDARFVRDVFYFMATHKEKFRSARVAIIVTMALRSGVKTAFTEMLAEFPNLPMPIKIFRTYRDAERWLSKGD